MNVDGTCTHTHMTSHGRTWNETKNKNENRHGRFCWQITVLAFASPDTSTLSHWQFSRVHWFSFPVVCWTVDAHINDNKRWRALCLAHTAADFCVRFFSVLLSHVGGVSLSRAAVWHANLLSATENQVFLTLCAFIYFIFVRDMKVRDDHTTRICNSHYFDFFCRKPNEKNGELYPFVFIWPSDIVHNVREYSFEN